MVCFLPSYEYEKIALAHWASSRALSSIASKKVVFREPKSSAEVESVLAAYSYAATGEPSSSLATSAGATMGHPSSGGRSTTGAILFCVVGAKMSEGINFSDGLARCVVMVGLPYPDMSDPELLQKMGYLDAQQQQQQHQQRCQGGLLRSNAPKAGQEYYQNLCMRAVNQSIGRAIRHIGDYAAILLVDDRTCHSCTT